MYLKLLEIIPDWVMYLIFPVIAWTVLALLTFLFRKVAILLCIEDHDSDVVDTATQNAMSGAYVMLAFSLILVVGSSDNFENDSVKEATQIESLGRLLQLDGSPQSEQIQAKLRTYADSVVNDEWHLLEQGKGSPKTQAYLQDVFKSLETLQPQTPRQTALFVEIMRKSDEIAASRDIRVTNSGNSLPLLYWIVSYLSLLGVLIIAALRMLSAGPIRILALCTQVGMISLLFAAVMIIDHPFVGDTKLTADNIIRSIASLHWRGH